MPESLTTLQLARRIADAVLYVSTCQRHELDAKDAPTQAVLEMLDRCGSWFCRVSEDAQGATVLTPYEQGELFR